MEELNFFNTNLQMQPPVSVSPN